MKRISIGFIGCGFAADLHVHAYRRVPGFEVHLRGACATDLAKTEAFVKRHGFESSYATVEQLLADPAIDVVDIITPPREHVRLIKQAMEAGKHVICEKPLNGYFGSGNDDKEMMYAAVCAQLDELESFLASRSERFFYAENYVYAPAVQKIRTIIEATGEKLLLLRGDESHSGSHAPHAAHWSQNGGGSLIRQGCHPLSALLYLKQAEAERRGESIKVTSVMCDTAHIASALSEDERGSILCRPYDVEDWAQTIITFGDNTRAVVESGDMIVGGVRNSVEAYTAGGCYQANIAPNNALMCYHSDDSALDGVYITEKVETKAGWQHVFLNEEEMRGYVGQFEDFFNCLTTGKEPESGFPLAALTMRVLYASYASAQYGKRFFLEY